MAPAGLGAWRARLRSGLRNKVVFVSSLKILFIGEGLVMAAAIAQVRARGHTVAGVFCTVAAEAETMARAGLPVGGPAGQVGDFVAGHDHDVLLSINNGHILKADAIGAARLAAINYHNGPLPAYAGRWVTAWAVLNGEASHGITWHLIEPGIDTGPILVQRHFALAEDETTGSLNLRCTQAAIESFARVLDMLESRRLEPLQQDARARSYYGKADRAPGHGVIDWSRPGAEIVRLVRACDWGSAANGFGQARAVLAGHGTRIVHAAKVVPGAGPAGTILHAAGTSLTVACGDGAVCLRLDRAIRPDGHAAGDRPTVIDQILAMARARPMAPAIAGAGEPVTRQALVEQARAMAARLVDAGVQIEDGVGILLPAGAPFVIAALGAMIAGGAYVPLSPNAPPARLLREMAEAGIACIITSAAHRAAAAGITGIPILTIEDIAPADPDRVFAPAGHDQCAYRIFTSGSTGGMKAVEITQASLANLAAHFRESLPLGEADAMTALSTTTFDASVADLWPILTAGGTLLIPPERILLDLHGLIDWLGACGATCASVPTAIGERLFHLDWPGGIALRRLLIGGDAMHQRPPAGLPFLVINTYGPTENTVDSLWAEIGPDGARPLIGRPIGGVQASVVDADRNPVAPGALGELVLGGAQVARGYRNRPDLTAQRFADTPQGRVYYTGDRVRQDEAGDFEFHGRIDDQVQVLGVRVEPGEIEALLKGDPRVRDAACTPIRAGTEVTGLAAHVSTRDGALPEPDLAAALRALLAAQLPPAIVPQQITIHAALPYTAAGKLDRKALARDGACADASAPDITAAADADPLAAIWHAALPGHTAAAGSGKFWDLGGDSLAAIELLLRIEAGLGVQIPVGVFLEDPSLPGLRRAIVAQDRSVIRRLARGSGCPIVLWYTMEGDLRSYQSLLPLLSGREVVGVMSPVLSDPSYAPASLEAAVADGLAALAEAGIAPPYAHFGFSWGGFMAFEAERQLERQGVIAPFVALAGTYPPLKSHGLWTSLGGFVRWLPRGVGLLLRGGVAHFRKDADDRQPSPADPIIARNDALSMAYRPRGPIAAKVIYFRESDGPTTNRRRPYFHHPDRGWHEWADTAPEVHRIDTDHTRLMGRHPARIMAEVMNRLIDPAPALDRPG